MLSTTTIHANLLLVDHLHDVENDSLSGEDLVRLWSALVDGVGCLNVTTKGDASDTANKLRDEVFKFLKREDRYAALVSTLLKSRCYHENQSISEGCRRQVAMLARTEYKKPFLQPAPDWKGKPEDCFPISVSHHYPFVGLGRFDPTGSNPLLTIGLLFGLDIVTFDDINRKMYDTVEQFVSIFRDSCSQAELGMLERCKKKNDDSHLLHEFMLLWALKEAYTKALGLGLGFDFGSFHIDFGEGLRDGLWDTLSSHRAANPDRCQATKLVGKVVQRDADASKPQDEWIFHFCILEARSGETGKIREGCACAAVGPIPQGDVEVDFQVDWTTLRALVDWHGVDATLL